MRAMQFRLKAFFGAARALLAMAGEVDDLWPEGFALAGFGVDGARHDADGDEDDSYSFDSNDYSYSSDSKDYSCCLRRAVRPLITGKRDFGGKRVHVVQIGLGTNSTFIQNVASPYDEDWDKGIDWILQSASSALSPSGLTGVAVEPAAEHAQAFRPLVEKSLPGVALVQCAIGDMDGDSELHLLPKQEHDALLRQAPWWQREGLERSLSYLMNMSCVGREHPDMQHCLQKLWGDYGVQLELQQARVKIWSWDRLARELNFEGCEVLVVDTEGFDVRILRSMIAHCRQCEEILKENHWPYVIQFETQGHSDRLEGINAEWGIINDLNNVGYTLVHYSHFNTHLARDNELWYNERVIDWAKTLVCARCGRRNCYPYLSAREDWNVYCQGCGCRRRRRRRRHLDQNRPTPTVGVAARLRG